jgi:glycosyltransferase involved in cell wall biosynthesis
MKVLWIVNTIFPAPSEAMGLSVPVFGGWMYNLAEQVSKSLGIEMAVATIYSGTTIKRMTIDGIEYFLLPCKNNLKYDTELEIYWEQVCNKFAPDIVHIHGTEYAHGMACMRKLPHLKYVVSIQGFVGVYSRYYYAGISFWEIMKYITFRDMVKRDSLFQGKKNFEKRGLVEKEYITSTEHVIGRTKWDFAHTKTLNTKVNYHFCNESLRDNFYSATKWSLENCKRDTVFLSQASYPIKGLHQVIKAVAMLKIEYPNLKIRVGGGNITKRITIKDKIKQSGYGKYIITLLKKHKLENDIVFLGTLSEEQMMAEYQRAHVFICPSSIENSPNSLGEAQLVGVPSIAAFVGGVPDMIEEGKTGLLYRFEEIEMLAENMRRVFNDDRFALQLSENGMRSAILRHDRKINLESTIAIYNTINE